MLLSIQVKLSERQPLITSSDKRRLMKVDTRETIMFLLRHIRDERHDGDNKNEIRVNNVTVMRFSLRFFT